MAVQDCEITLRWVEFPGGRPNGGETEDVMLDETFFGAIWEEAAVFGQWGGDGQFPIIDPHSYDTDVEQEIPLVIFQRGVRQLVEPVPSEDSSFDITLDGCGTFTVEGKNPDHVIYTSTCNRKYLFDLDDIIELFGP